jgi:hypothetical protein
LSQSAPQTASPSSLGNLPTLKLKSSEYPIAIIDEAHKTFIATVLTPGECRELIALSEKHGREYADSNGTKCPWRKLYTYTKADLPCSEVPEIRRITQKLTQRVFAIISEYYGCKAKDLRPRSWKEPHILRYSLEEGKLGSEGCKEEEAKTKQPHVGVEMHYDGASLSLGSSLF